MRHAEIADDGVEGAIRKRQCTSVAFAELDGRITPSGEGDLYCGKVDADDFGAAIRSCGRGIARAGGDVYDPRAFPKTPAASRSAPIACVVIGER
jgi:hypothetical protein